MTGAPDVASTLPRRTVLVVEDNDDARAALSALLELDGYAVETAADGRIALEVARVRPPHAALIDIGLPGIDGYEVATQLRGLLGRDVLLVALTGYGEPEDRRRATDAGFDAHMVKPVDPEALASVLSRGTPGPRSPG